METIIIAIITLAAGVVIGIFIGRKDKNALEIEINIEKEKNRQLQENIAQNKENFEKDLLESKELHEKQFSEFRDQNEKRFCDLKEQYEKQIANLKEQYDKQFYESKGQYEKQISDAKLGRQQEAQKELLAMEKTFRELTEKQQETIRATTFSMLSKSQKDFQESSKVTIDTITQPLKETIDKMKVEMQQNALKQTEFSTSLKASTEQILQQSQSAQKSTDELIKVMSTSGVIQGNWGELVLEELLTGSGLTKGVHFETQSIMKDSRGLIVRSDEGKKLIPDVIIHLDENRDVIIDSKVSMTAYLKLIEAQTEEDKAKYLKEHLQSVKNHVNELSKKDYSSYIGKDKEKIDFVIMFIPNTGAYWTALNNHPDMWRRALQYNVLMADEQTLFTALKTISMTWTQINQAKSQRVVFDLANELLQRVGQFVQKYQDLGKAINRTSDLYNESFSKLSTSRQSVGSTCQKLIDLGAKQDIKNPIEIIIPQEDILEIKGE